MPRLAPPRHRLGHHAGVPRPALLRLDRPLDSLAVGECRLHLLALVADHDHGATHAQLVERIQHVREQRPPGERVQDLGQLRAHALALTRGENDDFERHPVESVPILAF